MAGHVDQQSFHQSPAINVRQEAPTVPSEYVSQEAFATEERVLPKSGVATAEQPENRSARRSRMAPQSAESKMAVLPRVPKLRPAGDILNRLRWDFGYDSSDYIIGYVERFEGIAELPLNLWLKDSTEEDFIPQHRIRYFKRISDDQTVWDRNTKVDKVFGSGIDGQSPSGDRAWKREVCTHTFSQTPEA